MVFLSKKASDLFEIIKHYSSRKEVGNNLIKEKIEAGIIWLPFVQSKDQLANILKHLETSSPNLTTLKVKRPFCKYAKLIVHGLICK